MINKKVITMTHFNRPEYTEQSLESLAKADGIQEYTIYAHIDVMANGQIHPSVQKIIDRYKDIIPLHQVKFSNKNIGCNGSVYYTMNLGFTQSDYVIHIEDDIVVSKDALRYFEWGFKFYSDPTIFTIDGYNNIKYNDEKDIEYTAISTESYRCWGWATWIDRWQEMSPQWQFTYAARKDEQGKKIFEGGSWDVFVKKVLRKNRKRIFPKIPRTKNIGEYGIHTPSVTWHRMKHTVEKWANDYEIVLDDHNNLDMKYIGV